MVELDWEDAADRDGSVLDLASTRWFRLWFTSNDNNDSGRLGEKPDEDDGADSGADDDDDGETDENVVADEEIGEEKEDVVESDECADDVSFDLKCLEWPNGGDKSGTKPDVSYVKATLDAECTGLSDAFELGEWRMRVEKDVNPAESDLTIDFDDGLADKRVFDFTTDQIIGWKPRDSGGDRTALLDNIWDDAEVRKRTAVLSSESVRADDLSGR